jgi:hypothetical protein
MSDIVEKSERPGGALELRRVRQVPSGEPDVSYAFAFEHGQQVKGLTVTDEPPERVCRSISTLLITHSLTNHKIVGKLHTKPECFLNRCAS